MKAAVVPYGVKNEAAGYRGARLIFNMEGDFYLVVRSVRFQR
jgi:hypothetical protein